jgi:hypothetical protein
VPKLSRRLVLALPLLAAACVSAPPPRRDYPPLRFDYLTPLRLNVGQVEIDDHWHPLSAADVGTLSPVTPREALVQMAMDRIKPAGSTARAVFTVDDASMIENGDQIMGTLAAHLDILDADGARTGYAEARVARSRVGLGRNADMPGLVYDMTKQMMDAMNVEFEYQVRRNLKDWLVTQPPSALPAPVQQQDLGAPPPS